MLLAVLSHDYSKLGPRIEGLKHEVTCKRTGVALRLHFRAFRHGKSIIHEWVESAWRYLKLNKSMSITP